MLKTETKYQTFLDLPPMNHCALQMQNNNQFVYRLWALAKPKDVGIKPVQTFCSGYVTKSYSALLDPVLYNIIV